MSTRRAVAIYGEVIICLKVIANRSAKTTSFNAFIHNCPLLMYRYKLLPFIHEGKKLYINTENVILKD